MNNKTTQNKRFLLSFIEHKVSRGKMSFSEYVISAVRSAKRPRQLWNSVLHVKTSQSAKNLLDPTKKMKISPKTDIRRVVSRVLSNRFHPKSRQLFPFYFSNITLRTDLLTFSATGAVFKIAGEMRRLLAYFDNPVYAIFAQRPSIDPGPIPRI